MSHPSSPAARRTGADIISDPPSPQRTLPLPDDIILLIFTHLPPRSILTLSHVCAHLYALSLTPSLHHPHTRHLHHLLPSPPPHPSAHRNLRLRDHRLSTFHRQLLLSASGRGALALVAYRLDSPVGCTFVHLAITPCAAAPHYRVRARLQVAPAVYTDLGRARRQHCRLDLLAFGGCTGLALPQPFFPASPKVWRSERGVVGFWVVTQDARQTGEVVWVKESAGWVFAVKVVGRRPGEESWTVKHGGPGWGLGVADEVFEGAAESRLITVAVRMEMRGKDEMRVWWAGWGGQGERETVMKRVRLAKVVDRLEGLEWE